MVETLSSDPYKNFRFKVFLDNINNLAAGVNSVSGLSWSVDVVSYGEGGGYQSDRKLPGGITYESVTLSRGITKNDEFQKWAEAVWNYNNSNPLKGLRKTVIIHLCDENGQPAVQYTLDYCWVSEFAALPELSAENNSLAIETIKIEHEGFTQEILGGQVRNAGYR